MAVPELECLDDIEVVASFPELDFFKDEIIMSGHFETNHSTTVLGLGSIEYLDCKLLNTVLFHHFA